MATQSNTKMVQDLYSAFGRSDITSILNMLAEDVEWREPPGGTAPFKGIYRGRDSVGQFFARFAEAVEVESFEPREFYTHGDTVIALGHYRFRAKKTGKPYESDWTMVWRFRSGRVARFQIYKDSAAEAAALRDG